jgi:hypothetical protein
MPLQQAHDGGLAHRAGAAHLVRALRVVHEAGLAAHVGLVSLALARELVEAAGLHGEANPLQHEPRGLLGHADRAADLVGADAVLRVHQHPRDREPLVEADRRILEDGPDLHGELALALAASAPPVSAPAEAPGGSPREYGGHQEDGPRAGLGGRVVPRLQPTSLTLMSLQDYE